MSRPSPIRWISRQERAWDEDAVWKACLDLLATSAPESFSPEQRCAWLVWRYERLAREGGHAAFAAESGPALARDTARALERIGAREAAPWALSRSAASDAALAALQPPLLARLREWCDAFEPCFVREARPSCSA